MKVVDLLERRRPNWQELERLCEQTQLTAGKSLSPAEVSRLGSLYRAACADLALAFSYQLPQNTVQYLHRLVGRAHNQLYRSRRFEWAKWTRMLVWDGIEGGSPPIRGTGRSESSPRPPGSAGSRRAAGADPAW